MKCAAQLSRVRCEFLKESLELAEDGASVFLKDQPVEVRRMRLPRR